MQKLNFKTIAAPTISLFAICFVTTLLLCSTNLLTKNVIKNQEILASENAKKVVLPAAETFSSANSLEGDFEYFVGKNASGQTAGYVFTTEAKGYGGTIEVMVGINADSSIENVVILSHNETPGLGANVAKESFTGQFKAQTNGGHFTVTKSAPKTEREIQAVTGATISSAAVTKAVNEAAARFNTIAKGGN